MGWLSRLPIRWKAPLAVAILVLGVGASISAAAYLVLERTLHDHAAGRLATLATQYRETYRTSMASSRARIAEAAARPALAAYLREPNIDREAAARTAMTPPGPAPEWVVRVELRDAIGRVRLSASGPAAQDDSAFTSLDRVDGSSLIALSSSGIAGIGYGKLQQDLDAILFPIVARIGDPASGFLVTWRRVATSTQASQQIATVLGNDAATYMANADGSLWSEFGKPVASSPAPPVFDHVTEYDRSGRGRVLSVSGPMEGTPWAFVFEFPSAVVQAPRRTFLRTIAGIAAVCIVVGMLTAWPMSRRLTEPLHDLTKAADAIAAGDLTYRAANRREDELGRLVTSFNAMAVQVEESRIRLESLLKERTHELSAAEESLVRREKLALIGQFASGIGHEIRSPLGAMANAIYCLESLLPNATPEVRDALRILNSQVRLSAKIVNDLLDLARASPPHREPVNIAAVVAPRLEEFASNGYTVESDIPADLPAAEVDPTHTAQVIDNLLINARQAMGADGILRVKASSADGFVRVEVADTGPGVVAGNEARIFEPLFTTKARGTGLGLALSKSLAQANGGDLTLASLPGESARFVLAMPVARTRDEASHPADQRA